MKTVGQAKGRGERPQGFGGALAVERPGFEIAEPGVGISAPPIRPDAVEGGQGVPDDRPVVRPVRHVDQTEGVERQEMGKMAGRSIIGYAGREHQAAFRIDDEIGPGVRTDPPFLPEGFDLQHRGPGHGDVVMETAPSDLPIDEPAVAPFDSSLLIAQPAEVLVGYGIGGAARAAGVRRHSQAGSEIPTDALETEIPDGLDGVDESDERFSVGPFHPAEGPGEIRR